MSRANACSRGCFSSRRALTAATLVVALLSSAQSTASECDDARKAFALYRDKNGLVEPDKNPGVNVGAGNGVLYTAEMYVFLEKRGCLVGSDASEYARIIRSLQAAPGLINRNPPVGYHLDQEGPDDYIGLLAAGARLGSDAKQIAGEVVAYGGGHAWFFNNVKENSFNDDKGKPNFSAAFLRFPAFMAHAYWGAGQGAPVEAQVLWAGVMNRGVSADEAPDQVALQWLMIQTMPPDATVVAKGAATRWLRTFKKRFGGGIRDVMKLQMKNGEHPLVKYAPGPEADPKIGLPDELVELLTQPLASAQIMAEYLGKRAVDEAKRVINTIKDPITAVHPADVLTTVLNQQRADLSGSALAISLLATQLGANITLPKPLEDMKKKALSLVDGTRRKIDDTFDDIGRAVRSLFGKKSAMDHCDEERDHGKGQCERNYSPAHGYCDAQCDECDRPAAHCDDQCDGKCTACTPPGFAHDKCIDDCNAKCGQCGSDGCRGYWCNDQNVVACRNSCHGIENAGAGCRGAWCGEGEAVRGCRAGCAGRRNAAAGCRGAWCGDGQARRQCHNDVDQKLHECVRPVEAAHKECAAKAK